MESYWMSVCLRCVKVDSTVVIVICLKFHRNSTVDQVEDLQSEETNYMLWVLFPSVN